MRGEVDGDCGAHGESDQALNDGQGRANESQMVLTMRLGDFCFNFLDKQEDLFDEAREEQCASKSRIVYNPSLCSTPVLMVQPTPDSKKGSIRREEIRSLCLSREGTGASSELWVSFSSASPPNWSSLSLFDPDSGNSEEPEPDEYIMLGEGGFLDKICGGNLEPAASDGPMRKSTGDHSAWAHQKKEPSVVAAKSSASSFRSQVGEEMTGNKTAVLGEGKRNARGNSLGSLDIVNRSLPEMPRSLLEQCNIAAAPLQPDGSDSEFGLPPYYFTSLMDFMSADPPSDEELPPILQAHEGKKLSKTDFSKERLSRYHIEGKRQNVNFQRVKAVAFISSLGGDESCSDVPPSIISQTGTGAVSVIEHEELRNGRILQLKSSYDMDEVICSTEVGRSQTLTSLLNCVHCGQRSFLLSTYAPGFLSTSVRLTRDFLKKLIQRYREGEVVDRTECKIWISLAAITTPHSAVDMLYPEDEEGNVVPIRNGFIALCGPLLMDLTWREVPSKECLADIASRMRRRLRRHPENMVVGTILVRERALHMDSEINIPKLVLANFTFALTRDPRFFCSIGQARASPLRVFFSDALGGAALTTHVTCVGQSTSNGLTSDYFDYALMLQRVMNSRPFVCDLGLCYLKAEKLLQRIGDLGKSNTSISNDDIETLEEVLSDTEWLLHNADLAPTKCIRVRTEHPSTSIIFSSEADFLEKDGVKQRRRRGTLNGVAKKTARPNPFLSPHEASDENTLLPSL
ncbi:hypothetical protein TcCL_NonESM03673 [Trypanosoma cruzi]|uniref:Uncharacterized protein n=1 Tax=Trypanosoma cruzi (strain CL Brener) TaxID=353153 RepID=Q4CXX5_TRYCC|nr:hypothetical protein Tc00.1047053508669.30 [Trypanosoma cruzi]EAN85128.1 hypothetical protein Tc00.1047053508669.30 [Trypanosoma cruzi]RNC46516.1 hypothetical protein TcCL_NonESM03673 [Trypanosoma cruzi]|eukprot:XP_806979.1 hypothetical protein [Trypanosoma cruzi strain CL Brener]